MGMRQRLGVARCLLADPLLLILDEPTNGLDPGGIQEFREMIRAMVEQEGRTVFISSHLLDEVEKTCDAAAIVDRGKIITQGAIAELASGGGARNELILGVDDVELALSTLGASELVREAHRSDEGLRVDARRRAGDGCQVNATLVRAGVGVMRLEPVRHSLEQRFLEITSRLDAAPEDAPASATPRRYGDDRDRVADDRCGLPQAAQEAQHPDLGAGAGARPIVIFFAVMAIEHASDPTKLGVQIGLAGWRTAASTTACACSAACSSVRSSRS